MKKIINIIILFNFFFISHTNASIKSNIISKFKNVQNLSFKFKQNINEKIETGNCIIKYPKKIYCEYNNFNKKLLVSNGKSLVIKNQTSNQYYIYPIEKTALNLILDKDFLLEKMNLSAGKLIDEKYYEFKFIEGNNEINIYFDKISFNIIGWQNIDIYQNLVITYLFDLKINKEIKKNQFKLPRQN